jgi:hypothetical protein
MRMIQTMLLAGIAIASMAATPAHADWRWRHGPHGWVRFWGPAVVVAPPVVYAPPVYYAPPPVYYAPPVVYAPPAVVIAPPVVGFGVRIR